MFTAVEDIENSMASPLGTGCVDSCCFSQETNSAAAKSRGTRYFFISVYVILFNMII